MSNKPFKSGFVSILGRPNAGKSTLMNALLDEKVAIVSSKPQTTRNKILGILTDENHQIIFIDTPGMHKPKSRLGDYMQKAAESAAFDVDCLLYISPVAPGTPLHSDEVQVIKKFTSRETPVILIINKIDRIEKPLILAEIDKYKDCGFKEIVPISALKNENTDELLKTILTFIPEGPKYFPPDMITDQPERQLAAEIVREKALYLLQDEIPHGIAVEITAMKKRPAATGDKRSIIDVEASIYCEKESHKGIIIGKNGEMMKNIGKLARQDMERLLDSPIYLQLWIKVKKDWRNSGFLVKDMGYDIKQL